MISLRTIFEAGRVRRWHTNPDLSWTDDYLDGHQGRVARLICALDPDASANLLRAALTHDDGEWFIGDLSAPCKAELRHSRVMSEINVIEDRVREETSGRYPSLTEPEWLLLRLCDKIDAYMWARHKMPGVVSRVDWEMDAKWLVNEAYALGVLGQVKEIFASEDVAT